ncbi:MAG: hypothetical protein L0216_02570 [Planctomycetales bacterium]|nr:hypothetical protein [Planctomycetales bacterium]
MDGGGLGILVAEALRDAGPALALAFGVPLALALHRATERARLALWARRRGGKCLTHPGDPLPRVVFSGEVRGELDFPASDAGLGPLRATRLRLAWDDRRSGPLEIRPRGWLGGLALILPARRGETRTGDRSFDRAFRVWSELPAAAARAILAAPARRALLAAAMGPTGGGLALRLEPSGLVLRRGGLLLDSRSLDALLAAGAVVASAAAGEAAVRVVAVRTGGGLCPACSRAADPPEVVCPSCGAPHHRACWDWLGGCGIYRCAAAPTLSALREAA